MPSIIDVRMVELKVLENLADGTWDNGVCVIPGAGQVEALGITPHIYADQIVTLLEDGYLYTRDAEIRSGLENHLRHKEIASRDFAVQTLVVSKSFRQITVTYRGLRRIEELRDQLRRDRVLERFGILLDGRYIISDLIHLLESTKGEPVSLVFIDIDDFKQYNSTHGYQAGDSVLRQVFRIVRDALGSHGEVYRRGGDEIVALLPYCALSASKVLADHICETVAKTVIFYDGHELRVTVSIGVAASPPCEPDGPALEAQAGNAANRAKSGGKSCVVTV